MSTKTITINELFEAVVALQARIEKLEAPKTTAEREMTDDDARRVLNGDLKDAKHKDAAAALKLSYGQIYSCRLGYTFKGVHKELAANPEYKNTWIKA
jgi:hypothetical protein